MANEYPMKTWNTYLTDIRFWLFFFFLIRLYGITNPPLDAAHNWRQTTVTMVARNYLEMDDRFFYPRIDVGGEKSGITGMEFPLLNYLIFLISKLFGYQHWYGRIINLIISTFGVWYFFKILKSYFTYNHAFSSALLLLGSIWFAYSRKIMPDTFAVSLVFMGMYHGLNYLTKTAKWYDLVLYFIFTTLGILSKLPMGYLLGVFALPILSDKIAFRDKTIFILVNVLSFCIIGWFYFVWVPFLTDFYGLKHFFMGKSMLLGAAEIWKNLHRVLEKYYLDSLHISGFILFLVGSWVAFKQRKNQPVVYYSLLLCSVVFFLLMLKSGETFAIHSYYIVPFAPVMCLVAGYAASCFEPKRMYLVLTVVVLENIVNWQHDFRIKPQYAKFENLEKDLDKHAKRTDLIFVNSNEVPTLLYFAHRKGWSDRNEDIQRTEYTDSLRKLGLKFIVISKEAFGSKIELNYPKIDSSEVYDIYKLD